MKISTKMTLMILGLFAVIGISQIALEMDADARAGGGRSGGFRGSRSYQAPSRPAQPAQPRRDATPPPQQAGQMAPQSGGFMRGLGTAVLGGFLGSMLFSGLANAGGFGGIGGLGGSGFGLFEILLIAGIGYFLYRKFRSPAAATGHGTMQYQNTNYQANTSYQPSYGYRAPDSATLQETPSGNEVDYRSLTMMDRSFDPNQFLKTAQDTFFKIQGAWNKQDTAALNRLCGNELMQSWQEELSRLSARGQQNRMENIALSSSEITEAWTESGQDFITVRLNANLLDYTVDQKSGAVVSGSSDEPIQFEEYWTFSRPVGPNAWKLTAVQQA
ncbi:MAG TPA: Tim44/TimA family putative adaptor protein [Candidatus Polarisedimenticolaceae bacterium]|nr:Tim44/TimA family putative adaptor protein [Candidatus Polarisedimenticolaceae bacterium]